MIDDDDSDDVTRNLQRAARIEARQFCRVFRSADGRAVLEALKRDFGWDAAAPVPNQDGEIPVSRLRAWTGSRAVIGTILHKLSLGESLSDEPTTPHDEH